MASAEWSAILRTFIYTAKSSWSFFISQEVRFAWRVIMKSSQESCHQFPHCQHVELSFTQLVSGNKALNVCIPLGNA